MSVPIGYLVPVLLLAWCTFCALVAPRRPGPLGRISWIFGMVINEAPHFGLYVLVAITALALAQGDLASTGGRIAGAAAAVVAIGLVIVAWRGVRSDRAVQRALDRGLGAGWRGRLPGTLRPHRPWGRILLAPWAMSRPDVEVLRDLPYADGGRENLLDLYRRRDAPRGAPVLIYFHGGGFRSGRKSREARPLLTHLASRGWECLSANYRLAPQVGFPEHQIDAKKVIAWVREHGAEQGLDASEVFVAGSSAGANLAGLCALTPNDPRFQPGFEAVDTTVRGAVLLYGYYGRSFSTTPESGVSPLRPQGYVGAVTPPIFLAHGTRDGWGSIESARQFTARLREASGGPVVHLELPGGQHSFDVLRSARFEAVVDGVDAFTSWVLAEPPAA